MYAHNDREESHGKKLRLMSWNIAYLSRVEAKSFPDIYEWTGIEPPEDKKEQSSDEMLMVAEVIVAALGGEDRRRKTSEQAAASEESELLEKNQ